MKASFTIEQLDLGLWTLDGVIDAAIGWDDNGWVMETYRDGNVIDLAPVSDGKDRHRINWNAVMARVEELTK